MTDTAIQNTILDGSYYDPDLSFETDTPIAGSHVRLVRKTDNGAVLTYNDGRYATARLDITHDESGTQFDFTSNGPRDPRVTDPITIDLMLKFYDLALKYNNWPR